jgi:glycosyltransferase involved in cell wall biosynthesis
VHDAHFVYPRAHHGRMAFAEKVRYVFQRRQLARRMAKTDLVYCQTHTMSRRIGQVYGHPDRIRLLPNYLPEALFAKTEEVSLPATFISQANKYRLICLTRYYAHKNLEVLLNTFATNADDLKDVVLFLTIPDDQAHEAGGLLRAIGRAGLGDQIINLGQIPQSEVPAYFKSCHALLFPTLMESFSTTYLEAMHCGLPIMTSDLDFARDVCTSIRGRRTPSRKRSCIFVPMPSCSESLSKQAIDSWPLSTITPGMTQPRSLSLICGTSRTNRTDGGLHRFPPTLGKADNAEDPDGHPNSRI